MSTVQLLPVGQILYLPVTGPVGLGLIGGAALLAGYLTLREQTSSSSSG